MSERVHSVTGAHEIPMKLWFGYPDGWLTPGELKAILEFDIKRYVKRNPLRARLIFHQLGTWGHPDGINHERRQRSHTAPV
jgi:hypothetical protein